MILLYLPYVILILPGEGDAFLLTELDYSLLSFTPELFLDTIPDYYSEFDTITDNGFTCI